MGVELNQVRQLVKEIVESEGYEPVEIQLKGSGRQRVLQVYIDQVGGISHRDCEVVSEQVSTVLDIENLIPSSYTLEVSSPGLDRKLTKASDYERFAGEMVKIRTKVALQNQKVFIGRLRGIRNSKVQIEISREKLFEIPIEMINEARLEVDWALEMGQK